MLRPEIGHKNIFINNNSNDHKQIYNTLYFVMSKLNKFVSFYNSTIDMRQIYPSHL